MSRVVAFFVSACWSMCTVGSAEDGTKPDRSDKVCSYGERKVIRVPRLSRYDVVDIDHLMQANEPFIIHDLDPAESASIWSLDWLAKNHLEAFEIKKGSRKGEKLVSAFMTRFSDNYAFLEGKPGEDGNKGRWSYVPQGDMKYQTFPEIKNFVEDEDRETQFLVKQSIAHGAKMIPKMGTKIEATLKDFRWDDMESVLGTEGSANTHFGGSGWTAKMVLSDKGAVQTMSYELDAKLYSQVTGEACILFASPYEKNWMIARPYPDNHPNDRQSSMRPNRFNQKKQKFNTARIAEQMEDLVMAHLQPGESIVIPPQWWHEAASVRKDLSDSPINLAFEFVRRKPQERPSAIGQFRQCFKAVFEGEGEVEGAAMFSLLDQLFEIEDSKEKGGSTPMDATADHELARETIFKYCYDMIAGGVKADGDADDKIKDRVAAIAKSFINGRFRYIPQVSEEDELPIQPAQDYEEYKTKFLEDHPDYIGAHDEL